MDHVHAAGLAPLFAMWAAMMVGMMIPPEVPLLVRLARGPGAQPPLRGTAVFLAGFLAPWILFSLGAALLQSRLQAAGLMAHSMTTSSPMFGGALLVAAGVVQLSPLKRMCLERCRSPAAGRSFLGGVEHGAITVASCGLVMLVAFVTGVMNFAWMALITLLLLMERTVPRGFALSSVAGAALLTWGICLLSGG